MRYGLPTVPFSARPERHRRRPQPRSATSICSIACSRSSTPRRGGRRLLADHGLTLRAPAFSVRDVHREQRSAGAAWRSPSAATVAAALRCTGSRCSATTTRAGGARGAAASACDRPGAAPTAGGSRPLQGHGDDPSSRRPRSRARWATSRSGPTARLGSNREGLAGNSLPFTPASSVRPGMVMFDEHGDYDIVESVERVELRPPGLRPRHRAHPQLHRRRDRHPQLDLRVQRSRHPQHPRLRGRVPRRPRGPPGAELPLDADDPRCRQRGDRQQPRAEAQVAVDRRGAGATRSRSASSRTSTRRRGW